tara:strand:+ start:190 stop:771 length:582 start_codon:yes stop_codon:yes gene_type:complete
MKRNDKNSMEAIKNIITRNSNSKLIEPHPTKEEMELVYKSAWRAPDHANLKPSQFIEVTGSGLDKLSDIFVNFNDVHLKEKNEVKIKKYKNAPYRAPMVIILICNVTDHPKVPKIEQMLSTAAAAQNILLSLHALNYGAIWRTGAFALNEEISAFFDLKKHQKILGYLYVGTSKGKQKKIPEAKISDFVTRWS